MPTFYKDNYQNLPDPPFGGVPYGNLSVLQFKFVTNAAGIMVDSNKATAIEDDSVVVLGRLPAGMTILDCVATVSDVFTDGSFCDIGFLYCDGVDVASAAQDADYFFDNLDFHDATINAARHRTVRPLAPITLAKDAWLVLSNLTVDQSAAGIMDIAVYGVLNGSV